jgi:hypothetical protein
MLDRGMSGNYDTVGSERISKYEFVLPVAKTFGMASENVLLVSTLNTEKVRADLGKPMPDVDTGLRRFRDLHENGYRDQLKSFLAGAVE